MTEIQNFVLRAQATVDKASQDLMALIRGITSLYNVIKIQTVTPNNLPSIYAEAERLASLAGSQVPLPALPPAPGPYNGPYPAVYPVPNPPYNGPYPAPYIAGQVSLNAQIQALRNSPGVLDATHLGMLEGIATASASLTASLIAGSPALPPGYPQS